MMSTAPVTRSPHPRRPARNRVGWLAISLAALFTLTLLLAIPLASAVDAQGIVPTVTPLFTPIPANELGEQAEETAEDIVDFAVDSAETAATSLEDFIDRLTISPRSDIARVLLVLGGVVLLAAGWRVYDYVVIIAGLLIGALLAASLVRDDNTALTIGALLVGGLIGAAVSYFLYYGAVFLIGAYIGIVLTNAIASALGLEPVSSLALLVGGLIGGLVLIGLSFEFLVLLSSLVGAQLLALGLGLGPVWTLIFTVVGVVIQFGLIRAYKYDFRRRRRRITPFRRAGGLV